MPREEVEHRQPIAELVAGAHPVVSRRYAACLSGVVQQAADLLQTARIRCLRGSRDLARAGLGLHEQPLLLPAHSHPAHSIPARRRAACRPASRPLLARRVVNPQEVHALPLVVVEGLLAGAEGEVEPLDDLTADRVPNAPVELVALPAEVSQQVPLAAVAVADLAHESSSPSSTLSAGASLASLASCQSA